MHKRTCFILFLFFQCLLPFAGNNDQPGVYKDYYRQADAIYSNHESTEAEDRNALSLFEKVIGVLTTKQKDDSLLFESYIKAGTLLIGLDGIQRSIALFNAAIVTGNTMHKAPPAFFQPHLYCGRSWYTLGQYDSALYHYKIAESIADEFTAQAFDRERLFNMLGAVYYDLGNYKQSVNYFEKAIRVLSTGNPDYTDLITRYKNNIAASLIKLDYFDSANAICDELLREMNNDDPLKQIVWHRKANIHLALNEPGRALDYLNKLTGYPDRKQVTLLNDYANIYYHLQQYDSSLAFLQRSLALNKIYYPSGKNSDLAITFKIWGNMLEAQNNVPGALQQYHLSVLALATNFSDTSVYNNPSVYTGVFAANTLFESLSAKAAAFEKWYIQNKDTRNLEAAVHTYRSVFGLAAYMEKSYDTDEARLLLNKKKYAIHDYPIRICVQLYRLTGDKKFLENAFYFDEQNKASVLNENLLLLRSKKIAGLPAALLVQEKSLKQKITALLLKAAQPAEETAIVHIQNQVLDLEIELNKLNKKLGEYPAYAQLNEQEQSITPQRVQEQLDNQTMVMAWHMGESSITAFWFKQKKWDCFVVPLNDSFYTSLQAHVVACRSPGAGGDRANASFLYNKLLKPVEEELKGITSLAVIPDDELHQLPFETLLNAEGAAAGVLYSFCYNYSCNLLFRREAQPAPKKQNTLALAPFANDSTNTFGRLVFSADEISDLGGKKLLDKEAGKAQFLQWLPQYRVVHLATHAVAGNDNTARSFIAFNGAQDTAAQYLYREEIVNLDMDSVQLVYLSACETGYGRLVKGEGMISLSRAFAYAGCADIVTSLWQADDAATAIITKDFYRYYYNGYPAPVALQKAKINYLENPAIDKRKKTPFYWAHLVFVGQQDPGSAKKTNRTPLIIIITSLVLIAAIFFIKRKR